MSPLSEVNGLTDHKAGAVIGKRCGDTFASHSVYNEVYNKMYLMDESENVIVISRIKRKDG